jgi:hypothetical protein
MDFDAFISYATADKTVADAACAVLELLEFVVGWRPGTFHPVGNMPLLSSMPSTDAG